MSLNVEVVVEAVEPGPAVVAVASEKAERPQVAKGPLVLPRNNPRAAEAAVAILLLSNLREAEAAEVSGAAELV